MDTEAPAMKHLLALVLLLALVGAANATSLNFQNPGDFTQLVVYTTGGTGSISWTESGIGGNNYVSAYHDSTENVYPPYAYTIFHLKNPSSTTYAAATEVGGSAGYFSDPCVVLLDSSGKYLGRYNQAGGTQTGRWEVKIVAGIPYYYINGVLVQTGSALAANPSYVGFGTYSRGNAGAHYWDDYTYGDTENKNVLGISESDNNVYYILDDIINSAKSGVYNESTDTTVQANYLPTTWSRGNTTTPLTNQSIQLVSYPDNTVYATYYTGDAFTGTINTEMKTKLLDVDAPDGYYAMYMPGQAAYSNVILKKSNGASVTFNRDTYSTGDIATVITYVANGGYWDTSTYDYKLSLYGLTTGYLENYTITSQSGSFTHAWQSTDTPGVYYALLYATTRSTGQEHILGLDWAALSSYAGYGGYVVNAQNGTSIVGAFVNVTQDGVSGNSTSGFDGNWSTGSVFSTGAILTINASASGYIPYNYSWTPLAARTVSDLNVSMEPLTPSYTGMAIGGVDRDFLYGRPIGGAMITVRNTTTGESYVNYTNTWGWYLCDDGATCALSSKRPYDVWAYKVGYTNSTTERAVTK